MLWALVVTENMLLQVFLQSPHTCFDGILFFIEKNYVIKQNVTGDISLGAPFSLDNKLEHETLNSTLLN